MLRRILLLFILSSLFVYAQEGEQKHTETLLNKAYTHFYSNKDSASYYFNKVTNSAISEKNWKLLIETKIAETRCFGYFYDLEGMKTNIDYIDSLITLNKSYVDSLPNALYYQNSINYDKGNYYFKINNYTDAHSNFSAIIKSIESKHPSDYTEEDIDLLSVAYSFNAKMLSEEGKNQKALDLYKKNIRLLKQDTVANASLLNTNYGLLAEAYKRQNKLALSNVYFVKSLKHSLKNNNSNNVISVSEHLAQNFIALKQYDVANHYLEIMKKALNPKHAFNYSFYRTKAQLEKNNGNYIKAVENLEASLKSIRDTWGEEKQELIANAHNKIGLLHLEFNKPDKAIVSFDKALESVSFYHGDAKKRDHLKFLKNKSKALNRLNIDVAYEESYKNIDIGVAIFNSLKSSINNQKDKYLLTEDVFPMLEAGIEASYQLYKSTNANKYLDKAFYYSEQSKSVLLLEALLSANATTFANIPNTIILKEKELKSEITYLEKKLFASNENDDIVSEKLFNLNKAYEQLVTRIEKDYPKYYNLKYNTANLSLSGLKNNLEKEEQILSYFYGSNAIYVLNSSTSSTNFNRIVLTTELEERIYEAHKLLSNPKSDIKQLAVKTNALYEIVVAPFLFREAKKLTIIADGPLNYIPFGALNTKNDSLSYLVEDFAISYANSGTLLCNLREEKRSNNEVLAFAPSFSGSAINSQNRSTLQPLAHNKKEVENILMNFEGVSYSDESATLQNFNEQLPNYGLLHLATHAVFDDKNPEYSYLAFTNQKGKEDLLYISDLYNLQINANMVTLSACESGIGELKRGEGFLSLARGFFYAGANSITSTLWKINDASSAAIMDDFYVYLSKGEDKAIALQRAQEDFLKLNSDNALKHPYYWSGFVISGNTTALTSKGFFSYWWAVGIIVIALGLGYLLFFRKR